MKKWLKSFTRNKAVVHFLDDKGNFVKEEIHEGDFSRFAHGSENTNDFRIWDNGVPAEEIHEWVYPVPSHKVGNIEKVILKQIYGG